MYHTIQSHYCAYHCGKFQKSLHLDITITESWVLFNLFVVRKVCELHLIHIFQVRIFLGQACSTKLISVHSNVQWDIGDIHIRTVGLLLLHCFFPSWSDWEWQLGGGWCHCSFFATLCWDGRQQVRPSADCGVTLCCCFGKWATLLPGGSCWQRQLWLCVSCKSYCPSQLPFCPLPHPDGLHSSSNPCFSQGWECIWTYVYSPEFWLCSRAQANQTG